jgi:hypothetical protein
MAAWRRVVLKTLPGAVLGLLAFTAQVNPRDAHTNLAAWWQQLTGHSMPVWLTDQRILIGVTILVVLFYAGLIVRWHRRRTHSSESRWIDVLASADIRQHLIARLKGIAQDKPNVKLIAYPSQAVGVVKVLAQIFADAGWQTMPRGGIVMPQDRVANDYEREGISVEGYSRHLVDAVAEYLRDAGLSGVRGTVKQHAIKPDNAKYSWVQQSIRVTIGNQALQTTTPPTSHT